jgi:hypothetical protein
MSLICAKGHEFSNAITSGPREKLLISLCFGVLMDCQAWNCYIQGQEGEYMSARLQTATVNATARVIQNLAEQNHVTYHATDNDRLAHHMTRLAGDVVELDPIEQLLVGLQRVGRIDRALMVRLQARYLRETKP